MKIMKKEYFEPTMRVANLRHTNHLLAGSPQAKPYKMEVEEVGVFDGEEDKITDEDIDYIL